MNEANPKVDYSAAAHHFACSSDSIRRACAELCLTDKDAIFYDRLANRLSDVAKQLEERSGQAALFFPYVTKERAARALGLGSPPSKLAALARARAVLAKKREQEKAKRQRPFRAKARMDKTTGQAGPVSNIKPEPPTVDGNG